MKIIGELSHEARSDLMRQYVYHPLWHTHIGLVVTASRTYQVNLYPDDYKRVFVCAGLPNRKDPYLTVSDALQYIKKHPKFLTESADYHIERGGYSGRLSGVRISEYIESGVGRFDCFLLDVPDRNRCEVMDGMHRLIAYGLTGNRSPITAFIGVNRPLRDVRYISR